MSVVVLHKGILKPPEDCLAIIEVNVLSRDATDVQISSSPSADRYFFLAGKIGVGDAKVNLLTVTVKRYDDEVHSIKTSWSDENNRGEIEGTPALFSQKSGPDGRMVQIYVQPSVFQRAKDAGAVNSQFWAPQISIEVKVYDKKTREEAGSYDTSRYSYSSPTREVEHVSDQEFKDFMPVAERMMAEASEIAKLLGVK